MKLIKNCFFSSKKREIQEIVIYDYARSFFGDDFEFNALYPFLNYEKNVENKVRCQTDDIKVIRVQSPFSKSGKAILRIKRQ